MLQGLRKVPHEYSHLVLNPENPNLVEMLGNSKRLCKKKKFLASCKDIRQMRRGG